MDINLLKVVRTWARRQTLATRLVVALSVVMIAAGTTALISLALGARREEIPLSIGVMLATAVIVTFAPLLRRGGRS